jgi:hypothetical protein
MSGRRTATICFFPPPASGTLPHRMRLLSIFLSLILLGSQAAQAQPGEHIVLTGGPALRFMEHGKDASHDFYWFNFVDASTIWLNQIKSTAPAGDRVTWLVYKPAYVSRSNELGLNLVAQIVEKAKALNVNLLFFDTKEQLINYLNKGQDRGKMKIVSFDYFGHSNKACFLFDYSNTIDTMSICYLHVIDLKHIHGHDFAKDAVCKSWGCHSGELYSKWWKDEFDVAMTGAVGKTDFSHGGLPALSDANCRWTQ